MRWNWVVKMAVLKCLNWEWLKGRSRSGWELPWQYGLGKVNVGPWGFWWEIPTKAREALLPLCKALKPLIRNNVYDSLCPFSRSEFRLGQVQRTDRMSGRIGKRKWGIVAKQNDRRPKKRCKSLGIVYFLINE